MEKELTVENFEEIVLKSEKPVLVDFWATWCGPCMRQGPIVEELANEGYVVGKVNVDEQMPLAQQYRVMNIPTLLIFRDGKEAERLVGLTPKDTLKSLLDA
jgi:thioredoxin 1